MTRGKGLGTDSLAEDLRVPPRSCTSLVCCSPQELSSQVYMWHKHISVAVTVMTYSRILPHTKSLHSGQHDLRIPSLPHISWIIPNVFLSIHIIPYCVVSLENKNPSPYIALLFYKKCFSALIASSLFSPYVMLLYPTSLDYSWRAKSGEA